MILYSLIYKAEDNTLHMGLLSASRNIADFLPVDSKQLIESYSNIKLSEFVLVEVTSKAKEDVLDIKDVRIYSISNNQDETKELILSTIPKEDLLGLANDILRNYILELENYKDL